MNSTPDCNKLVGKYLVFSGEYIWKYTHNAYDFSILGNTPIFFPIAWDRSKIPGFAGRVSIPDLHGFFAQMVLSTVSARFFLPQVSIHRQMQTAKENEEQKVRTQVSQLTLQDQQKGGNPSEDLPRQVDKLIQLEMLRLNEKRLQEVPGWPFDKKTLEYFAAIFLSILTALLTRLLLAALNL